MQQAKVEPPIVRKQTSRKKATPLPTLNQPPAEEGRIFVRVEVSPEVAEGIKALNTNINWPSDTPCDEHNIEYLVNKLDRDNAEREQRERLPKSVALAFLDVYTALAAQPLAVAANSLRNLAILVETIPGLTCKKFALHDMVETDRMIHSLRDKAASGMLR